MHSATLPHSATAAQLQQLALAPPPADSDSDSRSAAQQHPLPQVAAAANVAASSQAHLSRPQSPFEEVVVSAEGAAADSSLHPACAAGNESAAVSEQSEPQSAATPADTGVQSHSSEPADRDASILNPAAAAALAPAAAPVAELEESKLQPEVLEKGQSAQLDDHLAIVCS